MNINYYNPYVRHELELYHHGIAGMRWGKRNGPPYPLAPSAHSASEKKAGWQKSLDTGTTRGMSMALNTLDKKRATQAYDANSSYTKARKYENKAAKAGQKGNWKKYEKLKNKSQIHRSKAEKLTANMNDTIDTMNKVMKDMMDKGYNINSKKVMRSVHTGKTIATGALTLVGTMSLASLGLSPIVGTYAPSSKSAGRKYKVTQAMPGTKGQHYDRTKPRSRSAMIAESLLRPSVRVGNRDVTFNKLRI